MALPLAASIFDGATYDFLLAQVGCVPHHDLFDTGAGQLSPVGACGMAGGVAEWSWWGDWRAGRVARKG